MEDLKPIIAKNIADLRTSQGLTQIELAEKLNYSDKAVSKWERAESLPDIAVLKEIADLFQVPLDYLVNKEHPVAQEESRQTSKRRTHNHGFITGISIILVWLVATCIFVITDITISGIRAHWLAFVYAVPVSMIVWLVLNSIWFNQRRNFLIISFLVWTVLGAFYLTMLLVGFNIWEIFILGIPGQIIIYMWSRLRYKNEK